MTAVRSLTLSHFRSHRLVRLSVDAKPVALFGPNGAGKTNLLEAVSILSPGRGLRRAAAQELGRQPEALGWKITAEVQVSQTSHEIETWWENGGSRQLKIDGKPASQLDLGSLVRVLWLVPAMDRLWIEGAEGRRRFLDRMALSIFPAHASVSLAYEKAMRERNRLLRDMVRDAAWYSALETQMAEAAEQIQAHRHATIQKLATAQTGTETSFPVADLRLVPGDLEWPEAAQPLQAAFEAGRNRDLAAGRTLIGPHRVDLSAVYAAKSVPARACSTGEQKALLVSLILANARALAQDTGTSPLLLLDEVAAHLDRARRGALYDELVALGAQAWMTGTERGLFEDLGARAQFFEVAETAAGSEMTPR